MNTGPFLIISTAIIWFCCGFTAGLAFVSCVERAKKPRVETQTVIETLHRVPVSGPSPEVQKGAD